jgi:hypothetical protein
MALGMLALAMMVWPTPETTSDLETKGGQVTVALIELLQGLVSLGTAIVTLAAAVITYRSARAGNDT